LADGFGCATLSPVDMLSAKTFPYFVQIASLNANGVVPWRATITTARSASVSPYCSLLTLIQFRAKPNAPANLSASHVSKTTRCFSGA
jgi:hypothetical protein